MPMPLSVLPVAEPILTNGVQQGRKASTALLRQVLLNAVLTADTTTAVPTSADPDSSTPQAPPTRLLLIDRDFAAWPLDEPQLLQGLADWMRLPGRRMSIVALDFDALARSHPRFARWRRDWVHRIEALCPADGVLPPGLRLLAAGPVLLQWLDAPDWRLRPITDRVQVQSLHEQCADFLQRCEPAWPSTTLGL